MLGIYEIIFLGIKTGIKLAQQGRQAYVEATINRELTIPLPKFDASLSLGAVRNYFRKSGKVHLNDNERLKLLFEEAESNPNMDDKKKKELILIGRDLFFFDKLKNGEITEQDIGFSKNTLLDLLNVRNSNSRFPSPVQRMFGSLIEIGVDYFANSSGTFDETSASGRALKGFLKSIEDLNFADEKVEEIAKKLFIGAVETIGENPDLLGADDKTSELVEVLSKGLVNDVRKRLDDLAGGDLSKREKIQDWAQLVLRSVLSSAGETVIAKPNLYLGIDNLGQQALVSSVGTSILDVIIDEDSVDLPELFSRDSLDKVVRGALVAVAENPDIFGVDNQGIKKILTQLAKDIGQSTTALGPDILPEVMRLVIEKSAQNLDLLWDSENQDPTKNLLIKTSKIILEQLARIPKNGDGWKPKLSHSQIIDILELSLDEVVQNPQWVIELAESGSPLLDNLTESVLNVLHTIPSDRLSRSTAVVVVKEVIKTVALRKEFLEEITFEGERKIAIVAILNTIINALLADDLDPKVKWTFARDQIFNLVVSKTLLRITETGISENILKRLDEILTEVKDAIKSNKQWTVELLLQKIEKIAA